MIYIVIGVVGFLILVTLEYLFTQELRQLYQRFSILKEQTERAKQRREYTRTLNNRAMGEEEEAKRRLHALREEVATITREIEFLDHQEEMANTEQGARRSPRGGQ